MVLYDMPAGITRGYANSFLDMLARVAATQDKPAPTREQLDDLDREQ